MKSKIFKLPPLPPEELVLLLSSVPSLVSLSDELSPAGAVDCVELVGKASLLSPTQSPLTGSVAPFGRVSSVLRTPSLTSNVNKSI